MATETFPSQYLRGPLIANLNRQIGEGFDQSDPASGPPYNRRTSFDNPVVYNLRFSFESPYKELFFTWVRDKLDGGLKPFNIDILTEFGKRTQEAWFTQGGTPQLESVQGDIFTYNAQIRLRELDLTADYTYDELVFLLENADGACPVVGTVSEEIDTIVNVILPESP